MILLKNAMIFDGINEEFIEGGSVLIEHDRIREVAANSIPAGAAETIDCAGRFLMPGLIDLHFHAYGATFDVHALDRMPKALLVAHATKHLEGALQRGFTTVRDPGGGDVGLALAIERGLIDGPRFLFGGKALSQTGGHGDMRHPHHDQLCACPYSGVISQVVNGVEGARQAAREELRRGADHIKVFISGGVASPSDPLWMPQFTNEEILAVVAEAATRRKYVAAHCHTDDGARRCVELGVRSVEHATHITDETAQLMAASGATYTVPTLAVVHLIQDNGAAAGMSTESRAKVKDILDSALGSIERCRRAGVKIGLGTDIFGSAFHEMQVNEFRYRAAVDKPIDILRSATSVNAEIAQREGELGVIRPGAKADVILLDGNPLQDISIFEKFRTNLSLIVKDGVIKRRMN